MARASIASMRHRADVQRDAAAGADDWNNAPAPNWQAHLSGVRCFVWSRTRRERVDDEKTAVIEDLRCMMPIGTDVTERDRIAVVKDRAGAQLYGLMTIEGVQRHGTHLELALEAVD